MISEFEADLFRSRTREGMKVAKAKGRLRGKQPKLSVKQEAHLNKLHDTGEYSNRELPELFFIGKSTVYRAIARAEEQQTNEATRKSMQSTSETDSDLVQVHLEHHSSKSCCCIRAATGYKFRTRFLSTVSKNS